MAKPREIRITFKEKEDDLYQFIQSKSSASAFLKDLAKLEQKREEIYLGNLKSAIMVSDNYNEIVEKIYDKKEENLPDISDLE